MFFTQVIYIFGIYARNYTVRHKNTQKFFHHNLKKSDPIVISFGKNIFDTTGHQMNV